jgi:hypothetical protein
MVFLSLGRLSDEGNLLRFCGISGCEIFHASGALSRAPEMSDDRNAVAPGSRTWGAFNLGYSDGPIRVQHKLI